MAKTINQAWILITLFFSVYIMKHAAVQSKLTVTIRLLRYISTPCPRGQVCDFSFYMCLDNFRSDVRGCAYNSSMTGVFQKQSSILFDQSAANPLIAYIPTTEEMALLRVVVFERIFSSARSRWTDTWWDSFNITLDVKSVSVQQRNLTRTGFEKQTRLTVSFSLNCTPPFYLSERACTKFCQERNDQYGHYTCTENGDRDCLEGWTNLRTNCTTPDPNPCLCANGGTCNGNRQCICVEGFTGPDCSERVDMCIPRTCGDDITTESPLTKNPLTEQPVLLPSTAVCGINIGLLVGFLLLLILVIVLIVIIIKLKMSMLKKETESHDTRNIQLNSPSTESNVAHSTLLDEHTYTNINNNDNLQHGTDDRVLPANNTKLDALTGESAMPSFRAEEIPGPGDSLYLEENINYEPSEQGITVTNKGGPTPLYEPTEQGVTVTNKEKPTPLYEHPWE